MDGRLRWGLAAVCTLLLVIGGRLVQLQGLDHGKYSGAAAAQRTSTITLRALRGEIVDRDGTPLAYTSDAQDITADPKQIPKKERQKYANKLAPLTGTPAATILKLLRVPKSQYAVLATALSPKQAQKIIDLQKVGIYTQATTQRQYPGGTTAANIIGTVHSDGEGAAGLEAEYNGVLAGRNGSETYAVASNGTVNPSSQPQITPARNGSTIKLTIDQNLQYMAQQYLDRAVPESGAKDAEMAVLDAHTGQVLALASSGTFDAANPNTIDPNAPIDPPVMSAFEPGSVQKAITFAAALQQKVITPRTIISVPDAIRRGGVRIADAWTHETSPFYATGILAESSNVGTLKIADRLGPKIWDHYEKLFGVGQKTGIELPAESSGYLPPLKDWSASTFANLPFGQGESMTILQLASIYQAIANDGVRVPPRIVSSVTNADGAVRATRQPTGIRVISPSTSKTLRTMLESVTLPGGTGVKAAIPGYEVAGKTGTAQQPQSSGGAYSSYKNWDTFAGMVPADNPQFVVAIMVDNPAHGVEGGDVAAPLFHEIASYELAHAKIVPTGAKAKYTPLQDCKGQDPRFLPADVCHA
ncbi:penicillin-binding protein 2 [Jatrophihabitans endophyticus]|uniref:peptidoglycan D,D-transpeptidase FtsI family protein n=1 Tax=Jatrophihabitans endophyticus TaxID=1206085 RepID=UPI001A0DB639|nr:penicillin-binding protein 2 [Jatrophihabitans endophyticus]MBE7187373.1 penicillin-binding protein 2 [Jatrophihabitans endophyticus]